MLNHRRPLCCHYLTGTCKFGSTTCKYRHDPDDGSPCCFGFKCHHGHKARRWDAPARRLPAAQDTRTRPPLCCFHLAGTCNRPTDCFYRHAPDDGASPCNFGASCRRGHGARVEPLAGPVTSEASPLVPPATMTTARPPPPATPTPLCCFHLGGSCKHPTDCRHRHGMDDGVTPCHFGAACAHGHASRVGGGGSRPLCCFFLGGVCKRVMGDCHYRHDPDDGTSMCNFGATCRYGHSTRSGKGVGNQTEGNVERRRPADLSVCEICDDESQLVKMPGCGHPPLHCRICLTAHITILIRDGRHSICCPAVGCTQIIDVGLIQSLVAKADFDMLNEALTRNLLSQDAEVVFCSNKACATQVTVANGKVNPVVTCPLCRAKTCFLCQLPWHSGLTCAEARQQRAPTAAEIEAQRLTEEYLRAETRRCPKCGTGPCMKTSADECDVATCPRCLPRFRFCWSCGADYDVIFKTDCKSHKRDCRFYR